MGDDIAPDVSATLADRCDETTLLSAHGEQPRIELHAPFGDERVTVRHGIPFVAVLERTEANVTVRTVGHFDYEGHVDGRLSLHTLFANYGPLEDHYNNLSADERQFVESLIQNQYRPSGPVSAETRDWSKTVFTGEYLVGEVDAEDIRRTGETIYPNDDPIQDDTVDFDTDRRDELIDGTIETLRDFALDVADVSPDSAYTVREAQFYDFRDRAVDLYTGAPLVTQTQAVSWALHELGLGQTNIATLRDKTQPTIHNHLERAAQHYVNATMAADAFGDLPRYMPTDVIGDVGVEYRKEEAEERFRFEKSLVAIQVKCPACGLDAGEWEGGAQSGDWAEEPTRFWQGTKELKGFQSPDDPRHVECPECGHDASRSRFESAWVDEHGAPEYEGPEPF